VSGVGKPADSTHYNLFAGIS